jgi:hypothetical protein
MDATPSREGRAVPVTRGTLYKFLPLPVIPHRARWFDAGPVSFALEARVLLGPNKEVTERSASVHVFGDDRTDEYVRFDCFGNFQHYHYIQNDQKQMVIWAYDEDANGPMLPWVLNAIRTRLPVLLRRAGADALAARVETEGFDASVLDQIEEAVSTWKPVTAEESARLSEEARAWYARWKELHPQFNTAA